MSTLSCRITDSTSTSAHAYPVTSADRGRGRNPSERLREICQLIETVSETIGTFHGRGSYEKHQNRTTSAMHVRFRDEGLRTRFTVLELEGGLIQWRFRLGGRRGRIGYVSPFIQGQTRVLKSINWRDPSVKTLSGVISQANLSSVENNGNN